MRLNADFLELDRVHGGVGLVGERAAGPSYGKMMKSVIGCGVEQADTVVEGAKGCW